MNYISIKLFKKKNWSTKEAKILPMSNNLTTLGMPRDSFYSIIQREDSFNSDISILITAEESTCDYKTWSDIKDSAQLETLQQTSLRQEEKNLACSFFSKCKNCIRFTEERLSCKEDYWHRVGRGRKGDENMKFIHISPTDATHMCKGCGFFVLILKINTLNIWPLLSPSLHPYHEVMYSIKNGSIKAQDFPSM